LQASVSPPFGSRTLKCREKLTIVRWHVLQRFRKCIAQAK
jgi:hypothetical protein